MPWNNTNSLRFVYLRALRGFTRSDSSGGSLQYSIPGSPA